MALEHASFHAKVRTVAEHYAGRTTALWGWPFWLTGLVTNMAAPAFWLIAGISVALYESARRRSGEQEGAITRFFLVRAALLATLDLTVIACLWGLVHGRWHAYQFDVLSSIALSLACLSVLRLLPEAVVAVLSLGLLLGYQALHEVARPALESGGGFWLPVCLDYSTAAHPPVRFPVLGWCGLMGIGLLAGRRLSSAALQRPRTWLAAGLGLAAAWLLVRAWGGYGNFVPYDPATPWYYFLVMSKGPPSLDFLLANLSLTAFAAAFFFSLRPQALGRRPWRWLAACGQASLFFYVAHCAVYQALGKLTPSLLAFPGLLRYAAVYLLGMALLVPLAHAYRDLKKRHPGSVLRYF